MEIKIIGGGSAGNHMAYALSQIKDINKIYISDLSHTILERSKRIYIERYKKKNRKSKRKLSYKRRILLMIFLALVLIKREKKIKKINKI